MMSRAVDRKRVGDDSNNGELLNEIGTISKALYSDKNRSKSSVSTATSRSNTAGKAPLLEPSAKLKRGSDDLPSKDKKPFWAWKSLKALSHVRHRRFNCCFTLQVHTIEDLPPSFNALCLCVHWKRRDGAVVTRPVKVIEGVAEFEEGLTYTCSVYGSRSGPHHSAKYEAKHFLLYAAVSDNPHLDLGKHRVDLTRLLPLTLEELEDENSSAKWSTTFKLSGSAQGALMSVTFGYLVLGDNSTPAPNNKNVLELLSSNQNKIAVPVVKASHGNWEGTIRHVGSLPPLDQAASVTSQPTKDLVVLHELFTVTKSKLPDVLKIPDEKFEQESASPSVVGKSEVDVCTDHMQAIRPFSSSHSDSLKGNDKLEAEDNELSISRQQFELSPEGKMLLDVDNAKVVDKPASKSHDLAMLHRRVEAALQDETDIYAFDGKSNNISIDVIPDYHNHEANDICTRESLLKELESALNDVADLEKAGLDTPEAKSESSDHEEYMEVKSNRMDSSPGLDDFAESIANEFLCMLGLDNSPFGLSSEGEPESPRGRLLREFEEETGGSLLEFDTGYKDEMEDGYDAPTVCEWIGGDFKLPSATWVDENIQFSNHTDANRPRAKVCEDLETETLMQEWGLNEKAFQTSPPNSAADFGGPNDPLPEEHIQLPPLGEGLGPFVKTKSGGFLRSMNPTLFGNAKNYGSLIMQISSPVVVPAEMGCGVMEILQHLSSVGVEKLSMQANKVMPLEDITGKSMQQIAWEAAPELEGSVSEDSLQPESVCGQFASATQKGVKGRSSKPRADKCIPSTNNDMGSEYVSLEDLAPLAMEKIETLSIEGLRIQCGMSEEDAPTTINATGSMGLKGAVGLQLLDLKGSDDKVDGLLGLSMTLNEWLRLDSGELVEEDQISERTSKLLAVHHATSTDLTLFGKGEKRRGKGSGMRCGLFGNNFTVALMVQLRDPLRDRESVGTPMLALIQVERVFVPPKPKIYSTVEQVKTIDEQDNEPELVGKVEIKEEIDKDKMQEESIPQYKISEVHVAGLKNEPAKKKLWGTTAQQQSGSRWLLANGMGKSNKIPFVKSKVVTRSPLPSTTAAQPGDTLWSVSARVLGTGAKWKELAALNPHIRNPDVILPNQTCIRLR
ncbi:hypothetical protein Ancab_017946 [Ancistrocladus abbreviatus]